MKGFLLIIVLAASGAAGAWAVQTPRPEGRRVAAGPPAKVVDAGRLLEDVRVLAGDEMEGRAAGTEGGARARAYLLRRFAEAGLKPLAGGSFEQPFDLKARGEVKARRGVNLVGHVRGTRSPERLVVVTAHYDHVGVRGGKVYNGADDNASGVAALLQFAAHFARRPPRHSFVFAALDAEEVGLQGAYELVRRLREEKRDVALNVNLDMVGHSEKGELYASGTRRNPSLKAPVERAAARSRIKLLLGHDLPDQGRDDWTSQSDHFAFHRAGIPHVYFGVEDHKDYHQPTDDFETITQDFFVAAAETILNALEELDASPVPEPRKRAARPNL
ncbi:MAG TPA: M20/M25/M40 family metallo-hydrolase [Pyrinomonadaceae bacterium]|nr:M20/M25/M40 family metallo-hydrolase [Pyrinomonadaceae bacterium]